MIMHAEHSSTLRAISSLIFKNVHKRRHRGYFSNFQKILRYFSLQFESEEREREREQTWSSISQIYSICREDVKEWS